MALEDYIRDQERKAKSKTDDIKSSAQDARDDTRQAGHDVDRTSDVPNG